jgi:hypothetical protein
MKLSIYIVTLALIGGPVIGSARAQTRNPNTAYLPIEVICPSEESHMLRTLWQNREGKQSIMHLAYKDSTPEIIRLIHRNA